MDEKKTAPVTCFEWRGLQLEWKSAERWFSNLEQTGRWALACVRPHGTQWGAELVILGVDSVRVSLALMPPQALAPTPVLALEKALNLFFNEIDRVRRAAGLSPTFALTDDQEVVVTSLNARIDALEKELGTGTGEHTGVGRILAERRRQIEECGYTAEEDDGRAMGELGLAAACYASPYPIYYKEDGANGDEEAVTFGDAWPWAWSCDKRPRRDGRLVHPTPEQRLRLLEKAGALCAAEIDRILRVELAPPRPKVPDMAALRSLARPKDGDKVHVESTDYDWTFVVCGAGVVDGTNVVSDPDDTGRWLRAKEPS